MKLVICFLGAITVLSTSVFSKEIAMGTSSGGGGVGVKCILPNGGTSIETLDLHEAKLNGLKFPKKPNSTDEAITLAATVMGNHYFSGYFKHVDQYIVFLKTRFFEKLFAGEAVEESDDGQWIYQKDVNHIPLSNDYGTYKIAPNCQLEQIAYFDDENSTLLLNKKLFSQMDFQNQAALFTHEIIYFLDRNYPSLHDELNTSHRRTSRVSRFFVGKLFSSTPPKAKFRSSEQTSHIICRNETNDIKRMTEFRIYPNLDGTFSLVLNDMSGFISPFRVSTLLDFTPSDFINFEANINYEKTLDVSDFETTDVYKIKIFKKSYDKPHVRFFKNNMPLGDFENVTCWIND
jgi:hypothetical protein